MRGPQSIASAFYSLEDGFSLRSSVSLFSSVIFPLFLFGLWPLQLMAQDPNTIPPQYTWLQKADLPSLTVEQLNTQDITIAIATDPQGNIYTLSFGAGVDKRNAEGTIIVNDLIPAGQLDSPLDIAVDEEGYIYIADYLAAGESFEDNGKIRVFDPEGNYLPDRTILTSFYRPLGIDVDSEKVYVAEYNDGNSGPETTPMSRIRIYYKLSGNPADVTSQVKVPYRIAVNSQGRIYVSQAGNDDPAVLVFDSNLNLLGELSNITSPGSVVVDQFDFLHVIEYNNRVDFSEFINFTTLDLGDILDISGQINQGQQNEEFTIKIFNQSHSLVRTVVQNIDFPLDIAFNSCDRMYVNNAEIFGTPYFFVPTKMEFDLEMYSRSPSFDTEDPVITCSENLEFTLPSGQNEMIVPFLDATATDICSATISQTKGPSSGSSLTAGSYEIEFTAEDDAGNTASCSFTILVKAGVAEASMEDCPVDITTNSDPNACGAIVDYSVPTASEGEVALAVTRTAGLDPGSLFPVGTTTVSFQATASDGEVLVCSFTVKVIDTQAPVIECRSDIEVTALPGNDFAEVDFPALTAEDNCFATITQTKGSAPGSEFPIGTTAIEFTATDPSGNTDTCSFNVIVSEAEPPSIECPAEEELPVLELDQDCGLEYQSFKHLITIFRNFQHEAYIEQDENREGDLLLVSLHVYDGEGGDFVETCEFQLQLVDRIAPVIDCPASSQVISPDENGNYILPDYRVLASDNCDEDPDFVQIPPPGKITAGTTVRLTATDDAGNTSTECTFTVVLEEEEAPSFVCPAPENLPSLKVDANCEIDVPDYTYLITSLENFDREAHFVQTEERVGDILEVTIEVYDGEGGALVNTCEFELQLVDRMKPVIDCPGSPRMIPPDEDGNYILPDYRNLVRDNCDENIGFVQIPAPGEITEGGIVTLSATDASGNAAVVCEFGVVLLPKEEPSFTCPTESELPRITLDENCHYDSPDLKDLVSDFQNFENSALIITETQQIYNHLQILIKVYDGFEEEDLLVGECNFTIELIDETSPVASCISELTVQLDENGIACISAEDVDNGSFDSCGDITLSLSQSSFTTADISNSPVNVILTVTDAAGITASCATLVTVEEYNPEEPDPFSCISSLTIELNANGEAILDPEQLYEGSLGPDAAVSVDKEVFTCADLGQQTVTLTYSGTSAGSCPVTITVVDIIPPEALGENIEVSLSENGTASISAMELDNGSTDNCGLSDLEFQISRSNFTCEDIGENSIDLEVTDASGNSSVTSLTVTVSDPLAACEGDPVEPPTEGRFVILFPNPGRGEVQFATSQGIELHRVEIFDMRGRFLDARELTYNPQTRTYHLDLRNFQTGVYTLKLYSNVREYIRRAIITTY